MLQLTTKSSVDVGKNWLKFASLKKVAIQIAGSNYELWDKAQIIVALTRTKRGLDIIFVGNKEETIRLIIRLVQTRNE